MPVVVQCFHCNAILELDDGFRGGVCRCSNCGSLLQVPRGDDAAPPGRKPRPAAPPPPSAPVSPQLNATSSRLDAGISRGQLDLSSPMARRQDVGVSSGMGGRSRVHPTKPITAAPASHRRPSQATAPVQAPPPPAATAAKRSRLLFWLGVLLAVLVTAVLGAMFIYYRYFYLDS
jgi:hypothetical protein